MRTPIALLSPALVAGLLAVFTAGTGSALAGDDAEEEVPRRTGSAGAEAAPAALRFLGLNERGAEEWLRVRDGAVVIRVPAGPFLKRPYQGWAATLEPESREVASFLVDKTEVTNARFARFLNAAGHGPDRRDLVWEEIPGLVHGDGGWAPEPGWEHRPVTAATGGGARAYAAWAGARLPRPDEWEKAAGGPEGRLYPWGDRRPDATLACFGQPTRDRPDPVGAHPLGASPYGALDMAGNAYDRVLVRGRDGNEHPAMLKGASWASPHPLNLRVLDLCMQSPRVADRTVGFRCVMDDPEPDRTPRTAAEPPVLHLARDFDTAVREARERRVPVFVSLLHDTCGQCDRTIAQTYRDPRFIRFCNENMVVVMGHQPWDADDDPHPEGADGACTVHPGLTCREHEELYRRGFRVLRAFRTSPGNFVLHPDRIADGAAADAVLIPERELPKWGGDVDAYLAAFRRARERLAEEDAGRARADGKDQE